MGCNINKKIFKYFETSIFLKSDTESIKIMIQEPRLLKKLLMMFLKLSVIDTIFKFYKKQINLY
jgi:hypothetical protein